MENPYQLGATADVGSKRSNWSTLGMILSLFSAVPCALLVGFAAYMLVHDYFDNPLFRKYHIGVILLFSVAVALFAWSAVCFHVAKPLRGSVVFLFGFAYVSSVLMVFA